MAKASLKTQHRQQVRRVNQWALGLGGAVAIVVVLAMLVSIGL